jgi:general secretion pathway protein M
MEQLKSLISDAQAAFQRLSQRERTLVLAAGGTALAFILFLVLLSFSSSAAGYRRRTDDKLAKLREVQTLAASFREAEQSRQMLEQQLSASNVRLTSYLEEKGNEVGLVIPTMTNKGPIPIGDGKIQESSVEFTLNDIKLRDLSDFLATIENGPGVVKVKFLRIEPKVEAETLTAWVNIATYQLKP